jgi:hypothetical protein
MASKIELVQEVGINMTNQRGDRLPMHIPSRLCLEIIKALESWKPPAQRKQSSQP